MSFSRYKIPDFIETQTVLLYNAINDLPPSDGFFFIDPDTCEFLECCSTASEHLSWHEHSDYDFHLPSDYWVFMSDLPLIIHHFVDHVPKVS